MNPRGFDARALRIAAAMAGVFLFLALGPSAYLAGIILGVRLFWFLVSVGPVIPFVVLCYLLVRFIVVCGALEERVSVVVLAPDSFDPVLQDVVRFAAQLSRVRVWGWSDRSAVRVLLDADEEGRMRYSLTVPSSALPALRSALSVYDRVQIRAATIKNRFFIWRPIT